MGLKDRIMRRGLLTGGLTAAAAWLTGRVAPSTAQAATGDPMILGARNQASQSTVLELTSQPATGTERRAALEVASPDSPAISARSGLNAIAVLGVPDAGPFFVPPNTSPTVTAIAAGGIGFAQDLGIAGISPKVGLIGASGVVAPIPLGDRGIGVFGIHVAPAQSEAVNVTRTAAIVGSSFRSVGVRGSSDANVGVAGRSSSNIGIVGASVVELPAAVTMTATGVLGIAPRVGIAGIAAREWPGGAQNITVTAGVFGSAQDALGIGVLAAHSAGGIALDVSGRARFSASGMGTVDVGQDSAVVRDPAVVPSSHVIVTLMSDPRRATLDWVEPMAGMFAVHLASPVKRAPVRFCYLVIETKVR